MPRSSVPFPSRLRKIGRLAAVVTLWMVWGSGPMVVRAGSGGLRAALWGSAGPCWGPGPCGFSGRGGVEGADPDQVVDRGFHLEPGPVALSADVEELAAGADGLDPSEGFLDAFADLLGDGVPGVAGRAPVDRGAPVAGVLRDMRREPQLADTGDEVFGALRGEAGLAASY